MFKRCTKNILTFLRMKIPDILKSCILYANLKVLIIQVIEKLPRSIFMELKVKLMGEDLVSTPEVKTLRKQYRRFINGMVKIVDPNRLNEDLELLLQKKVINLGFAYFIQSFLTSLLDDS